MLFALVTPLPVRPSFRCALTQVRDVRPMPLGEVLAVLLLFASIPHVVVAPIRIVDATPMRRRCALRTCRRYVGKRGCGDEHRQRRRSKSSEPHVSTSEESCFKIGANDPDEVVIC
jgi:hypothetical protein